MSRRARVGALLAVVVVIVVVAVAAYGFGGRTGAHTGVAGPARTAQVTRMTLTDYADAAGTIDFGAVSTLRYAASDGEGQEGLGLLTWLAPVGSTVDRGGVLFRVDERPVVLLIGELPIFRTLRPGSHGADVRQLEENLAALGGVGFTVDDSFTESTASALRRWQRDLGREQTGELAPGDAVVVSGPVRIADHRLVVGDVADGDILAVTGLTLSATAVVDLLHVPGGIAVGTPVTLILPDGSQREARVRSVRPDPDQSSPTAVQVTAQGDGLDGHEGAVTVRFVVAQRADVLAVPVVALVALLEGGYGVQVVEGSSTRYIPVEVGLVVRGFAEVASDELHEGMSVVVPS